MKIKSSKSKALVFLLITIAAVSFASIMISKGPPLKKLDSETSAASTKSASNTSEGVKWKSTVEQGDKHSKTLPNVNEGCKENLSEKQEGKNKSANLKPNESNEIEKNEEEVKKLKKRIEEYISQFPGKYGIYYINLETGHEFGINATDEYIAASTSKLPINLYLYTKIEDKTVDPEKVLVYKKEDYEPGAGRIQLSPFGTKYTVREASKLSIEISDNCAINMIIRLLGIENIRQYMLDLGGSIYYGPRYRSCPKDMAIYMKELYRLYQKNPEVYGELLKYLENTIFNDRINALLPKNVRVAHKIGNQVRTMNDVGIVFARQPYILSVMSDDVNPKQACEVIAKISKMIFDFVQEEE